MVGLCACRIAQRSSGGTDGALLEQYGRTFDTWQAGLGIREEASVPGSLWTGLEGQESRVKGHAYAIKC